MLQRLRGRAVVRFADGGCASIRPPGRAEARMAEIVLGIGPSHSPMLSTPHEAFAGHRERDQQRVPEFAALARERAARVGPELAPAVTAARHAANQAALATLAAVLAGAALDALVIIGDDQGEWFSVD